MVRQYESYYWLSSGWSAEVQTIASIQPDVIIAHDMSLALALRAAGKAKVIFDAHEYFPRQFEDRMRFRLMFLGFNRYFCKRYIPHADGMMTVCQGIADQYEKDTSVAAVVWPNMPFYQELEPVLKQDSEPRIRMVHHGRAIPSRKLERMIEMMEELDERFELDMLLVAGGRSQRRYLEKLRVAAKGNAREDAGP